MAADPICPHRRLNLFCGALALLLFLSGCQKGDEIAHYRVPKEQEFNPPVAQNELPSLDGVSDGTESDSDRMLGAIVPHGDKAWFFKLVGRTDVVSKYAGEFVELVESIKFSSAGSEPQWTLPKNWQQKPGSEMRYATLVPPAENSGDAKSDAADAKPLEVSVTSLPWSPKNEQEQLTANINRWRGQMQIKPLGAGEIGGETKELSGGVEATIVNLVGHMKAGGMTPPFAGAAGGGAGAMPPGHPPMTDSLPAGHPPVADSLPPDHPAVSGGNNSADGKMPHAVLGGKEEKSTGSEAAPGEENLPLTFTASKNWRQAALPTFAVAAFALGNNSPRPEVTITPLPPMPNGIAANVNRWRAQLGLPEASADELAADAKPYKVDGQPGNWVRLVSPEGSNPQREILAVVVEHDGMSWIFALKAEAAIADNEQPNFQKFIDSVKFRPGN